MVLNWCQPDSQNSGGYDIILAILGDGYEKVIISNFSYFYK